ncbi:MAG: hypothetical protein ACRBBN_07320 [Methyloligellaceae bacterium]
MKMISKVGGALVVSLCMLGGLSTGAQAIECNGSFQVLKNGHEISTPYCQDNNLAYVAQEYGLRVSARTIRYNPNKKRDVCRVVGHDNRVSTACASVLDRGGRGRYF